MSCNALLEKLRATPAGSQRTGLFEQIERAFGRGFAKSLRQQLAKDEITPEPWRDHWQVDG